jgi:DNA-binding transcriptional regulator YdaS (Cro superfamily)
MMTLSQYLKDRNLTQRTFAAQVGVSPSYMNEIVQGVKAPRMTVAAKIERLTGGAVPMAALLVPATQTTNTDAA